MVVVALTNVKINYISLFKSIGMIKLHSDVNHAPIVVGMHLNYATDHGKCNNVQ